MSQSSGRWQVLDQGKGRLTAGQVQTPYLPSSCEVSHSGKVTLSPGALKITSPVYKGCTLINLTTTQSTTHITWGLDFRRSVLGGHMGTLSTVVDQGPSCHMGPGSACMQYFTLQSGSSCLPGWYGSFLNIFLVRLFTIWHFALYLKNKSRFIWGSRGVTVIC